MLIRLSLRNVALIDELELSFSDGFSVLTGETGAGKSIIIDAVNFLLGERATRELIKTDADRAFVQAVFSYPDNEELFTRLSAAGITFDPDDTLLLSRELLATGKGTCRINNTIVTLSTLKSISDLLVDVHGQHAHQSLLDPQTHIQFLDSYDESAVSLLKEQTATFYHEMQTTQKELLSGFTNEQERARRIDMLGYQINEIASANLRQPDEEEYLDAELRVLNNAQNILSALETSYAALTDEQGGALCGLDVARKQIGEISTFHEDYETVFDRLQDTYYALDDIGYTLRDLKGSFEFQPKRMQEIELRLDCIHSLKRKYGASIAAILAFNDHAQAELDELQSSDARRAKLQETLKKQQQSYQEAAAKLTNSRRAVSKVLSAKLVEQLTSLGMTHAQFHTAIEPSPVPAHDGQDHVEFMLSTNIGEPAKPLHKVASGGELSRIMLAFKTLQIGKLSTMVFDEIDTGISGQTANIVGQKIALIAQNCQVLCVTHLAQIAAQANAHYLVKKNEVAGHMHVSVTQLDEDGRIHALASLMGAKENDIHAIEHARGLLTRL